MFLIMLPSRDILSFSSVHHLDQQTYSKFRHKNRLLWELVSIIKPTILRKANKRTRDDNHCTTLKIDACIKTSQSLELIHTFLDITDAQGYTKMFMTENMLTRNNQKLLCADGSTWTLCTGSLTRLFQTSEVEKTCACPQAI